LCFVFSMKTNEFFRQMGWCEKNGSGSRAEFGIDLSDNIDGTNKRAQRETMIFRSMQMSVILNVFSMMFTWNFIPFLNAKYFAWELICRFRSLSKNSKLSRFFEFFIASNVIWNYSFDSCTLVLDSRALTMAVYFWKHNLHLRTILNYILKVFSWLKRNLSLIVCYPNLSLRLWSR